MIIIYNHIDDVNLANYSTLNTFLIQSNRNSLTFLYADRDIDQCSLS